MPYVARDPTGRITAVYDRPNESAAELCRVEDPDLLHFLGAGEEDTEAVGKLVASDLEMIRVVEDLILLLIEKRVVMLTELPKAAQHKLARRHELRSKMSDYVIFETEAEEVILP